MAHRSQVYATAGPIVNEKRCCRAGDALIAHEAFDVEDFVADRADRVTHTAHRPVGYATSGPVVIKKKQAL